MCFVIVRLPTLCQIPVNLRSSNMSSPIPNEGLLIVDKLVVSSDSSAKILSSLVLKGNYKWQMALCLRLPTAVNSFLFTSAPTCYQIASKLEASLN